eukprot:COSAG01_NODE_152_length_23937_cov_122.193976_3_plen_124_part_00
MLLACLPICCWPRRASAPTGADRLDAWHRGTPVALDRVRWTHHHVWRRAEAEWVNWQALAPLMAAMPTRFLSEVLSVEQRAVLGFPPPGNAYWSVDTIDAVGRRYDTMDMSPYSEALASRARL